MRTVVTNGCFDILHAGHVEFLERARALGGWLVVALNSDESVRKLKGPGRPVNNQDDRCRVVAALRCVSEALVFDTEEELRNIIWMRADVLVKGDEWRNKELTGEKEMLERGGAVAFLSMRKGLSTTEIIRRIQEGRNAEERRQG